MTGLVLAFPGTETFDLVQVGGKGHSLIRMAAAGLPVPPGAVLTTDFFVPWFDAMLASTAWTALLDAGPSAWRSLCDELKRLCAYLELTKRQRSALEELRRQLATLTDGALFAVRSSSPDEDLKSASFAGGYETTLGVRGPDLESAVRRCFASAFDERVLVYKREHGFDLRSPRVAVVVQQQIASEVAGVGFSLNPLTNDYDEAVIDANWGLGESVVAGLASPDHFVLDKVSRTIVESHRGSKQLSVWLSRDGGTERREAYRSGEMTLSETQLREILDALCRIENLHGEPTDIEWAWADGRLYVLQARPITTYIPLPAEMLTSPGERRRLYSDSGLSQGMVINRAISPLGLSWLQDILYARLLGDWLGIQDFTPAGGLVFAAGCRFYMNVSNVMWLGMSPKQMARGVVTTDALLAEIMANIDPRRYRAAARPAWVRARLLLFLPRVVWAIRGFFWNTFWNLIAPERGSRRYRRKVEAFEAEMARDVDGTLPLTEFARTHTQTFVEDIVNVTLPALIAGLASPGFLISRRSQEASALAVKFRRGFTGNLVVEQGIALFRLAKLLGLSDSGDIAGIVERLQRREMPGAFMNEWNSFVGRFGCRGPHEMDVASPRYADDPTLALEQISSMVVDDSFDPERAHRRHVKERRRAYEDLLPRLGWLRRALLRRIYRLTEAFGGSRDTPKYHAVLVTYAIRKRALIEGRRLVTEGRLDAAEDVFDLRFADLEAAARGRALDLRGTVRERKRFSSLAAHVTEFPQLIDSRGRILRPAPRDGKPGELAGMAVSPGSVIGPVKVLRNPREKPVAKGDVLVAYATDPGWTPLFVNAAAVVLEVGGVLQHGAVIAREYGKPCVVGVDRVVSRLRDGQTVEVDGTAGVIRLVGED